MLAKLFGPSLQILANSNIPYNSNVQISNVIRISDNVHWFKLNFISQYSVKMRNHDTTSSNHFPRMILWKPLIHSNSLDELYITCQFVCNFQLLISCWDKEFSRKSNPDHDGLELGDVTHHDFSCLHSTFSLCQPKFVYRNKMPQLSGFIQNSSLQQLLTIMLVLGYFGLVACFPEFGLVS